MGGIMGIPGKGLALTLNLKNKSPRTLYVLVSFVAPDSTQRSEEAKQLNASQSAFFSCPLKTLIPDKDYPVEISIYTDEGRKNLIENPKTKFRFSGRDASAFEEVTKRLEAEKSK